MAAPIPTSAFTAIIEELEKRPLPTNTERYTAGIGKSQTFGLVNRRMAPVDYSRLCWTRPYLYALLIEFGKKYVPEEIAWTSITLNQNYKAAPHYDKGNVGDSFLVGFGNYTGGRLRIHEGDLSGSYDINCKPIITNFSQVLHSVEDFEGTRYSLVYYKANPRKGSAPVPPASVRLESGKWKFYRGDEWIDPKVGLPHPLRGRKVTKGIKSSVTVKSITEDVTVVF